MLLFCTGGIWAQDTTAHDQNRLMELIETNIENSESAADFNTILEHLEFYAEHPLDINKATTEELASMGLFSDYQIRVILQHRREYGNFLEVGELNSLGIFDPLELELIYPYLTTKSHSEHESILDHIKGGSHLLLFRTQRILEDQEGYTTDPSSSGRYEGSPWKFYSRYRYHSGYNFSTGFTLEKDAGEALFSGSNKASGIKAYQGFDFASAHLLYRSDGLVRTVALGDYELRFGQGLVMWNGISFRKSAFVMNVMKSAQEINKYSSVNEYNYLRGSAIQIGNSKVKGVVFYSSKSVDANITAIDSTNNDVTQVSSFQESGNHRTQSEIADESAINQKITGARVTWNGKHIRAGITGTHTKLDSRFEKTLQPYNRFDFSGSELSNISVDYKLGGSTFHFFGESALSSNGGHAIINGFEYHPDTKLSIVSAHRSYSKEYSSFYANAFGERSTTSNEQGLYIATSFRPIKYWEIWAYYDIYRHPWLKFQADAPTRGKDYLVQLNHTPSSSIQMYWRFKDEIKEENKTANDTPADYLIEQRQTKFRYHLNYQLNYYFSLKSRFEYTLFSSDEEKETGYMLYQDLQYRIPKTHIRLTGRLAYFDTESFDAAIYAYESDVQYSFTVPPYYYKGVRTYLILRVKPVKGVACWIRYARTVLTNQNMIGSGSDEINGNTRSELKFQVAWTF